MDNSESPDPQDENVFRIPEPPLSKSPVKNKRQTSQSEDTSKIKKSKKTVEPSIEENVDISIPLTDDEVEDSEYIPSANGNPPRVMCTEPINVAAHLALLGESMTAIGELMIRENGNMDAEKALPILLDAFLCATNSVMCLTQCLPETNGADAETLANSLACLNYIMPGV